MTLKPPSGSNSPLLDGLGVFSLDEFGPHGDGATSDQAAWDAAVAATPAGGTLVIPIADFYIPTPIVSKGISIVGYGIGSAIHVNAGVGTDGLIYDPGTLKAGLTLRDFSVIGGASACRYGLVVRRLADSVIEDVYVKAGGTWEVSLEGLLVCKTRIRCPGNNYTFPYSSTRSTNGIRVVGSSTHPANANTLDNVVEALAGDGMLIDATVGSAGSFNNEILGTYQGITGKPLHIKSASYWKIAHAHFESSGVLTIENCSYAEMGRGLYAGVDVSLVSSDDIEIDGAAVNQLTIDSNSDRTKLGRVAYNLLGTGGITDNGSGTTSDGRLVDVSGATKSRGLPGSAETNNLLPSDGIRKWDVATPKPLGSFISPGTITKTGDGQADTRKLFPPFAALIQGASAVYFEKVTSNEVEQCKGNHVTFSAWVYIPSGQANQPAIVMEANIVGGLGTATGQSTAATDAWTRLSITVPVATASTEVNLKLRNTVASTGDWYIAGTSCVLGRTGPRSRPDRVVPKRYAEMTWDMASTADGAVANQNVTVQGCAVGDKAEATYSTLTGNGAIIAARVVAANTVQVTVFNKSGVALDPASGTLRVWTESPS